MESLQDAERAAQSVTGFFQQGKHTAPSTLRPSPHSAAATTRVFGLPEIAERIYLNLDPLDLLRVQQVNTTMLSMIEQSPNLQRKFLLQPDSQAFFTPIDSALARPFSNWIRFRRKGWAPDERNHLICIYIIDLEKPASLRNYGHGSRIQHMLVCQPPIFELHAQMLCDCSDVVKNTREFPNTFLGQTTLTSESGFTLQELRQASKSLHQRHQSCFYAQPHQHDSEGHVDCSIRFEARLELRDEDPRLIARQALLKQ